MASFGTPTIVGDEFEVLDRLAQCGRRQTSEQLGVETWVLERLEEERLIVCLHRGDCGSLFQLTEKGSQTWRVEHHKPVN